MYETPQPVWRTLYETDDETLRIDETGIYPPELDVLVEYEDDGPVLRYTICCEQYKRVTDDETGARTLVPLAWDETWSHRGDRDGESWFDLPRVAESVGTTAEELRDMLCSDESAPRARAYRYIADYHGLDNFDAYPIDIKDNA